MRSHDAFRHKLRRRLLQIADARRRASAGRPSGADLKVIARCETLAASGLELDAGIWAELDATLADPAGARRFAAVWTALPEAFATTLWPCGAAELVTWMIRQAAPDTGSSRRTRMAVEQPRGVDRYSAPASTNAAPVTRQLSGGLAAVASMLAIREVSVGLGQRHDAGVAARHPGLQARVIAEPPVGGRGASPGSPATIAFTPVPGAPECHVLVDLGSRVPVDGSIAVVPHGHGCTTPLVPATIGDPAVSFGLAAGLAMVALLSLKSRCWLRRRFERAPAIRPGRDMRLAS